MGGHKFDKDVSPLARLIGSMTSGVLEISIFHPFDTTGKRLMSYRGKFKGSYSSIATQTNSVVFREHAEKKLSTRYMSLYKGVGTAGLYKICQRVYRFTGQPVVAEYTHKNYSKQFENMFGPKYAKTLIHALAGALAGIGEVTLVPLDVLKIKRQVNPDAFKGNSTWSVVKSVGIRNLYAGSTWTVARNAPGSFAMFGGAAFAKDVLMDLEDYNSATLTQNFYASCVGSIACITIANPLDVIKTRVQSSDFGSKASGVIIAKNTFKNEGLGAFYKGFIPKAIVVAPKLIFAYTTALSLMSTFDEMLKERAGISTFEEEEE